MKINAAEGSYYPSYFYINIDTEQDIDCIENNESTFVHEYIHFLQDLILPYCIRCNLGNLNEFAYILTDVFQTKTLIRPYDRWSDDQELINKQNMYTWGDNKFVNNVEDIMHIEKDFFSIPSGPRVYKYILQFEDFKYQVGARDFLEYIANKIEGKYEDTKSPNLPYITVDKIFEYYGLADIPIDVRICIIEYCLYNDNPIHMFVSQFLDSNYIKDNIETFMDYKLCSKRLLYLGWNAKGGFSESIFSKTERRQKQLKTMLCAQYNVSSLHSVEGWINYVIEYCKENLSNKFIFSELYNLKFADFNLIIKSMVNEIGIPLIENSKHIFMHSLPKDFNREEFIMIYIIYMFMDYVNNTNLCCPIIDFCRANCTYNRNECTINPLSGLENVNLCPFKSFLKLYGLDKIKFEVSS